MTDFLLLGGGEGERRVQTKVVDSVEALKPLLNPTAWEIVKLLRRKEAYPAEIAKKLNLNEQTVYYYIKQLKASGLIEVARTESSPLLVLNIVPRTPMMSPRFLPVVIGSVFISGMF